MLLLCETVYLENKYILYIKNKKISVRQAIGLNMFIHIISIFRRFYILQISTFCTLVIPHRSHTSIKQEHFRLSTNVKVSLSLK